MSISGQSCMALAAIGTEIFEKNENPDLPQRRNEWRNLVPRTRPKPPKTLETESNRELQTLPHPHWLDGIGPSALPIPTGLLVSPLFSPKLHSHYGAPTAGLDSDHAKCGGVLYSTPSLVFLPVLCAYEGPNFSIHFVTGANPGFRFSRISPSLWQLGPCNFHHL